MEKELQTVLDSLNSTEQRLSRACCELKSIVVGFNAVEPPSQENLFRVAELYCILNMNLEDLRNDIDAIEKL